VPFCVQADADVILLLAKVLQALAAVGDGGGGGGGGGGGFDARVDALSSLLRIAKANICRLVASRVPLAEVGLVPLGADAAAEPAPAAARALRPLLDALNVIVDAGGGGSAAGALTLPSIVAAEAADVLDAGLSLFYPDAAAHAQLLARALDSGEGGFIEFEAAWPTRQRDVPVAAAAADGNGDGDDCAEDAVAAAAAASAAAIAAAGDSRYERAALLLQQWAAARGFPHATLGRWGTSLHVLVDLPDSAARPIAETLSAGLAAVLGDAGLPGWALPLGCAAPAIPLRIERFADFDRAERAAANRRAHAECVVHLYPRRVAPGGLAALAAIVRATIDDAEAAARAAAQAAAAASGDAIAGAGADAARALLPALDVFGDPPASPGGAARPDVETDEEDGASYGGEDEDDDEGDYDEGEDDEDEGGFDEEEEEEEEEEGDEDDEGDEGDLDEWG
jgi:hypothetical protein